MDHVCYCIALRKISRRLTSVYDAAMAPFGITITQFSQLRTIRRKQPVSLSDLADLLDLDRSTVGRNTKVLQRMGLIATLPSEDQRENTLVLTKEAEDLLEKAVPVWREVQHKMEKAIDPSHFDRLLAEVNGL